MSHLLSCIDLDGAHLVLVQVSEAVLFGDGFAYRGSSASKASTCLLTHSTVPLDVKLPALDGRIALVANLLDVDVVPRVVDAKVALCTVVVAVQEARSSVH